MAGKNYGSSKGAFKGTSKIIDKAISKATEQITEQVTEKIKKELSSVVIDDITMGVEVDTEIKGKLKDNLEKQIKAEIPETIETTVDVKVDYKPQKVKNVDLSKYITFSSKELKKEVEEAYEAATKGLGSDKDTLRFYGAFKVAEFKGLGKELDSKTYKELIDYVETEFKSVAGKINSELSKVDFNSIAENIEETIDTTTQQIEQKVKGTTKNVKKQAKEIKEAIAETIPSVEVPKETKQAKEGSGFVTAKDLKALKEQYQILKNINNDLKVYEDPDNYQTINGRKTFSAFDKKKTGSGYEDLKILKKDLIELNPILKDFEDATIKLSRNDIAFLFGDQFGVEGPEFAKKAEDARELIDQYNRLVQLNQIMRQLPSDSSFIEKIQKEKNSILELNPILKDYSDHLDTSTSASTLQGKWNEISNAGLEEVQTELKEVQSQANEAIEEVEKLLRICWNPNGKGGATLNLTELFKTNVNADDFRRITGLISRDMDPSAKAKEFYDFLSSQITNLEKEKLINSGIDQTALRNTITNKLKTLYKYANSLAADYGFESLEQKTTTKDVADQYSKADKALKQAKKKLEEIDKRRTSEGRFATGKDERDYYKLTNDIDKYKKKIGELTQQFGELKQAEKEEAEASKKNVDFKSINSQLEQLEMESKETFQSIAQVFGSGTIASNESEEYYKEKLAELESIQDKANKAAEALQKIEIPEDHETFNQRANAITSQLGTINSMIKERSNDIHAEYDKIDFAAQKEQKELERNIAERQSKIVQLITGNSDFIKYGEQSWLDEYQRRAKDGLTEIDDLYAEFEKRLSDRKQSILEAEVKEERQKENKESFINYLKGISTTGSEEFGQNMAKYADIFNQITDDVKTLDEAIAKVKADSSKSIDEVEKQNQSASDSTVKSWSKIAQEAKELKEEIEKIPSPDLTVDPDVFEKNFQLFESFYNRVKKLQEDVDNYNKVNGTNKKSTNLGQAEKGIMQYFGAVTDKSITKRVPDYKYPNELEPYKNSVNEYIELNKTYKERISQLTSYAEEAKKEIKEDLERYYSLLETRKESLGVREYVDLIKQSHNAGDDVKAALYYETLKKVHPKSKFDYSKLGDDFVSSYEQNIQKGHSFMSEFTLSKSYNWYLLIQSVVEQISSSMSRVDFILDHIQQKSLGFKSIVEAFNIDINDKNSIAEGLRRIQAEADPAIKKMEELRDAEWNDEGDNATKDYIDYIHSDVFKKALQLQEAADVLQAILDGTEMPSNIEYITVGNYLSELNKDGQVSRNDDAIVQYINEMEQLEEQSNETREAINRVIEQTRDAESSGSSMDLLDQLSQEEDIIQDIGNTAKEAANKKDDLADSENRLAGSTGRVDSVLPDAITSILGEGDSADTAADKIDELTDSLNDNSDSIDNNISKEKELRKLLSTQFSYITDSDGNIRDSERRRSWTERNTVGRSSTHRLIPEMDQEGNPLFDEDGNQLYSIGTTVVTNYTKMISEAAKAYKDLLQIQHNMNIEQQKAKPNVQLLEAYNDQLEEARARLMDAYEAAQEFVRVNQREFFVNDSEYDSKYVMDMFLRDTAREAAKSVSAEEVRYAKTLERADNSRAKNIDRINDKLSLQRNLVEKIRYSYDKEVAPGVSKPVTNQEDLKELNLKRNAILDEIVRLQGKGADATKDELRNVSDLIAEYQRLARSKKDSNNLTKREMGGQSTQVAIKQELAAYDKLIDKSRQFGDLTTDITRALEDQRNHLENFSDINSFYDSQNFRKTLEAQLKSLTIAEKRRQIEAKTAEKDQILSMDQTIAIQKLERYSNQLIELGLDSETTTKEIMRLFDLINNPSKFGGLKVFQRQFTILKQGLQDQYAQAMKAKKAEEKEPKITDEQKLDQIYDNLINKYKELGDLQEKTRKLQNSENADDLKLRENYLQEIAQLEKDITSLEGKRRKITDKNIDSSKAKEYFAVKDSYDSSISNILGLENSLNESYDKQITNLKEIDKLLRENANRSGKDTKEAQVKNEKNQSIINSLLQENITLEERRKELLNNNSGILQDNIAKQKQLNEVTEEYNKNIAFSNSLKNARLNDSVLSNLKGTVGKLDPSKYIGIAQEELIELKRYIQAINENPLDFISPEGEARLKHINDLLEQFQNHRNASEFLIANENMLTKLEQKIQSFMQKNSGMGKEFMRQFEDLKIKITPEMSKEDAMDLANQFIRLQTEVTKADKLGKSFFKTIKEHWKSLTAQWVAQFFSFQDMLRYAQTAYTTIVQLDDALLDLKKTTTMSNSDLEEFYKKSGDIAKEMGVTSKEIISQASAWSRLGFGSKEAAETMAQLSSKFASISPGMNTDEAQTGLVSLIKAWNVDVKDVERELMDNINTLGNKFALSNKDIIEGMERAGATLSVIGTSVQDSFALFTGAQEVIQNAETVGVCLVA